MEVDLPVWTIAPDWSDGITERLEWLTDVLASDSGCEQRRAVRTSPRRSFEITVNPAKGERTYLDLVLHRLGSETWLFPIWHDQGVLPDLVLDGATRIDFDNTYREHLTGGYALLRFDAFTWEVVAIEAQDDTGLSLAAPLVARWPEGTHIFPLRIAKVGDDTQIRSLSSVVGQSQIMFLVNESNDYPADFDLPLYEGAPLLTIEPDRSARINLKHTRLSEEFDGKVGLTYRRDTVGRAFGVQSHSWVVGGRAARHKFRSFLYALRGRQKMVWLPSFNQDVTVTRITPTGSNTVSIEKIGLGYVAGGDPIPGRERLWTGSEVLLHANMHSPLGPQEERIGLQTPTGHPYAPGDTWSFLVPSRLNQDGIEINHRADSDGVMECAAGFMSFSNDRDGSNFV